MYTGKVTSSARRLSKEKLVTVLPKHNSSVISNGIIFHGQFCSNLYVNEVFTNEGHFVILGPQDFGA